SQSLRQRHPQGRRRDSPISVRGTEIGVRDGREVTRSCRLVRHVVGRPGRGGAVTISGSAVPTGFGFTLRWWFLRRRVRVTDQFRLAVSRLTSVSVDDRLHGVLTLEQIMLDSARRHQLIIAELATFLRHHQRPVPATYCGRHAYPRTNAAAALLPPA